MIQKSLDEMLVKQRFNFYSHKLFEKLFCGLGNIIFLCNELKKE